MISYLKKTTEYALYLTAFFLSWQTRWIIRPGAVNGGYLEYGTISLYGTDILILLVVVGLAVLKISSAKERRNERMAGLKKFFRPNSAWFYFGLFELAVFFSIFFASDRLLAFFAYARLLLFVGFFWALSAAAYDKIVLIRSFLGGVFLEACLGLWQFFSQSAFANKWLGLAAHQAGDLGTSVVEAAGYGRWLRAYGGLDHPNLFGGLLAVSLIFILHLLAADNREKISNKKISPPVLSVGLVVFSAALLASFSRSAWLALAAGLIVWFLAAASHKDYPAGKFALKAASVFMIVGLLFVNLHAGLFFSRLKGEGRLENISVAERLDYFSVWQKIIKRDWLFGAGIGNYSLAMAGTEPGRPSYYYQPIHNVFLLVWAEVGFLSVIALGGLVGHLFATSYKQLKAGLAGNYAGLALIAELAVFSVFDHWLWSLHSGLFLFVLIIGLHVNKNSQENNQGESVDFTGG